MTRPPAAAGPTGTDASYRPFSLELGHSRHIWADVVICKMMLIGINSQRCWLIFAARHPYRVSERARTRLTSRDESFSQFTVRAGRSGLLLQYCSRYLGTHRGLLGARYASQTVSTRAARNLSTNL
jgi:hypothetical protein